jgi:hypothetical protein
MSDRQCSLGGVLSGRQALLTTPSGSLRGVVKYDNISHERDLVVEACPQRLRGVSGRRPRRHRNGACDRSGGPKGRHRKANDGPGVRRYGNCTALPLDAYRVVYAAQIGDAIWVVHAFQKKSTKGIATPQKEVELIKTRLKRLKEMMS